MVQTTVDYRKAQKKIQKTQKEILKAGKGTVETLARLGQAHARSIAPRLSGKTASLIKVFQGQEVNGPYATVVAQNPTANRSDGFNLVKWMHATNGILQSDNAWLLRVTGGKLGHKGDKIIKSGSPKFMYRTTEWLRRQKIPVAKGQFNKIKIQ